MRKSALFWLGLVVTALVALGLVVLSTASEAYSARYNNGNPYFFLERQCMYLVGGLVICVVVSFFDYHKWRDWQIISWLFFVVVLVLLAAVFGFDAVKGSHRWIKLGPIRLQPGELAKLVTVIILAVWMDKAGWKVELLTRGVLWPSLLMGCIALPVLLEPDFGSTMVIGSVGLLVMWVAGARLVHLLPVMGLGGAVVAYKLFTNANRMARLFDDSKQYQAKMALAAIGNSDIWGAGLGQSMQKYLYLPEAHTDFIFAIGAEELGIVFSVGTVLLFTVFFAICIYIARKAADRFGRYLVVGMAYIIYFQAMFNIGVVCKAFPTKGMALPFFSYGGTNLFSTFFAVGMIMSVGIHSYREKKCQKSVLAHSRFRP